MKIKIFKRNTKAKVVFGKSSPDEEKHIDSIYELIKEFCQIQDWENKDFLIFRRMEFSVVIDNLDFDSEGQIIDDAVLQKLFDSYEKAYFKKLNPRNVKYAKAPCVTTVMNKYYIWYAPDGEVYLINSEHY